ncbi:MAG: hypothetical protein NTW29_07290 [Bacteroidetes bacterium]|nr:hypothetical protein [Bacteroidota bacterium]
MNILCIVKTYEQQNQFEYEKLCEELEHVPTTGSFIKIIFCNKETGGSHEQVLFQVSKRAIMNPVDLINNEYFTKSKCHFTCILNAVPDSKFYRNVDLLLSGYFVNGSPDFRQKLKEENTFYIQPSHRDSPPIEYVLGTSPVKGDVIEWKGGWALVEAIEQRDKKTIVFIQQCNLPLLQVESKYPTNF